ncbi:hypothetical protein [Limosilactobacillus frumenti]|uniref:hypothetical protein n=1 Tax=Limosilactobacillus frumenti TaxID=104955 RepID=UPI00124AEC19|nr:hypothetical protein [Limosilactobacillus frumenti]QFG72933.1 hypothetical protein LF145_06210 [Limosilactobacillus frumenti]
MRNRKYWLISASVLLGLVCGSGMVHADSNTAINNQPNATNVTNVVTTQSTTANVNVTTTQNGNSSTNVNVSEQPSSVMSNASAQTDAQKAAYYSSGWHEQNKQWTYSKDDGTEAEDEWLWIDNAWYYFDGPIMAANGWHGTKLADGSWKDYYFDQWGHYMTNTWHVYNGSWTYSKDDGTAAEDQWLWINGYWYYFDSEVMAANGWHGTKLADGSWKDYYFDQWGHYMTNTWHVYNGSWTYSKDDGTAAEDQWLWINGHWYYFDSEVMAANGWHGTKLADGSWKDYYFDQWGHYMTNTWHVYNGSWTYSKDDGTAAEDQWLWINGHWYYFDNEVMVSNGWHSTKLANGSWKDYYFDQWGHMIY